MRRDTDTSYGKILFVISGMATFGLLACTPAKTAAPRSDIVSVTVKFEDSSGYAESTLHLENLGKPLADFIAAARAAKKIKPAYDSVFKDTGGISDFLEACGCDSPTDSLEIHLADGKSEKYRFYCDEIRALGPGKALTLELSERDKEMQTNRWQAIRYRFCPKAYGCTDASPPGWKYFITSPSAKRFSDKKETIDGFGWIWARILDSSRVTDPRVNLVFAYQARGNKIRKLAIDSLDGKYADLGRRFLARSMGMRRNPWAPDSLSEDSATVHITAYNAYFEK